MRRFALILLLWPGFVAADEFQQLTGDEILMALAGKKLDYGEGITQTFDSNMQTQYFSGRPSSGRWAVRDDRYKLIEFCVDGKRTTRLFDLENDPHETKDLAGQKDMWETQLKMRILLEASAKQYNDRDSAAPHIKAMSEEFWTTYRKNSKSTSCHPPSSETSADKSPKN